MFSKNYSNWLLLVTALGALSACRTLDRMATPKSYSESNPARALADVRGHNGYYTLQSVEPDKSKLVVRSSGAPRGVQFTMTTDVANCEGMQYLGKTIDPGRGFRSPNDAYKIVKKEGDATEYVARDLTPGQSVIVRATSHWMQAIYMFNTTSYESGSCGPLYTRFTPVAGHNYLVQLNWEGYDCTQGVVDASDPDNPVPIPSEPINMCPYEIR